MGTDRRRSGRSESLRGAADVGLLLSHQKTGDLVRLKSARMVVVVFALGWMIYVTWTLEVSRRNSERALATAAQTCGLLYREMELRNGARGQEPPTHPSGCNWVD